MLKINLKQHQLCSGVVFSQKAGNNEESTTPTILVAITNIYMCSPLCSVVTFLILQQKLQPLNLLKDSLQVCRHHRVSYFICSTISCCQEQILPYLYVLYIQSCVRVMFITTDVIEILMVDGTLKLENFIPIQIGKLFFIHAVSFGYLEDIGAYCTFFLSVVIIF